VVSGVDGIVSTSPDGLYGAFIKDNAIRRVRLENGAVPETVWRAPPGIRFAGHTRQNPTQPWIFILAQTEGERWNGPCFVLRDDGSDVRQFDVPGEYIGHMCWAADGSGMLRANTPWAMFKPFPLTADTPWRRLSHDSYWPNHIGACDRDAHLVTTDGNNQTLHVTDTATGHTYTLCVASGFSVAYSKDGDPHPQGSPDGPWFYRVVGRERCGLRSVPSAEIMATRLAQPPRSPQRLFIEAETCSMLGAGGLEASTRCYGRQYVACQELWLAVPYALSAARECVVWLRADTHGRDRRVSIEACRAGVSGQACTLRAANGFAWQRLETAPGQPLRLAARASDNGLELRGTEPLGVDRICITDDVDFVPPDEPNAKLPAPVVQARATSPYAVSLTWPAVDGAVLYDLRDARTAARVGQTDQTTFSLGNLPPNSERALRVYALNPWALPGEPSAAVVCGPQPLERVWVETEAEACPAQGPLVQGDDADASAGKYVHLAYRGLGAGSIQVTFRLPAAGPVVIAARTLALWPDAVTPDVTIDDGKPLHLAAAPQPWQWHPACAPPASSAGPPSWAAEDLPAGEHTVTIRAEHDGVCLDRVVVTNDLSWRPDAPTLVRQAIAVRTVAAPGSETRLRPGGDSRFSLIVQNMTQQPLAAAVAVERVPDGMRVEPATVPLQLPAQEQRLITFQVQATQPTAHGYVRLSIAAEGCRQTVFVPVQTAAQNTTILQAEAEETADLPPKAHVVASTEAFGRGYVELTSGRTGELRAWVRVLWQ
jgi:hypothetical protein